MDDCNGTHENGNMELLMDGDYRNYCGDHDGGDLNDGNYNNADSSNLFTNTWCEGPFLDGAQVHRNKDLKPFNCCFKGLGLVHCN